MGHGWRFFRAGGFDQVDLRSGADLVALDALDQKLWVALACPVDGLEFDRRTLALIDTDRDGRVRARELLAAIRWAAGLVDDPSALEVGAGTLPLASISERTEEGRLLLRTARAVLATLGRPEATAIALDDAEAAAASLAQQPLNGDGVVTPASTTDPELRRLLEEIVAATPAPPPDRSGAPGVDRAAVAAFFDALAAWRAWWDEGAVPAVRPLGADTPAAYEALAAVRAKVDDWFVRCRALSFDPRAGEALNGEVAAYAALAGKAWSADAAEIAHLPLARVAPGAALPLVEGMNPAWQARIGALREGVVLPLLGARTALGEADWREVCARMAGFEAWWGRRAGAAVEGLGDGRVRELLAGDARARVEALIAADAEAEPMVKAVESLERLVRYCRDLLRLANNFVAFRDFYARTAPAVFQAGTLYLDQRSCDLCVRVTDAAKHASMAPLSGLYLVYCDLRHADGERMSIVAAMTNGDVDNLMVGRNGVFYDRHGRDWDATVTRIVANPISLRQAFWAPYRRAWRMVEDLVAKRVGALESAADAKLAGAVGSAEAAADGKPPDAAPSFDVGTVAALGVAVGGLTAALGAVLQAFFGLGLWMPAGLVGLVLLISGPSMLLAWLKLRERNLGPLLDASGWAVNAQARLNLPLGASLTALATLPGGSEVATRDPFAERQRPWALYATGLAVLALALGWYIGKLDPYLPGPAKSTVVLGAAAPAAEPPP